MTKGYTLEVVEVPLEIIGSGYGHGTLELGYRNGAIVWDVIGFSDGIYGSPHRSYSIPESVLSYQTTRDHEYPNMLPISKLHFRASAQSGLTFSAIPGAVDLDNLLVHSGRYDILSTYSETNPVAFVYLLLPSY